MRTKLTVVALFTIVAVTPLWGHHAFAAEFDAGKPVKLRGTVTKMEWINPHAWIHVDVKDADGKKLFLGATGTGAPGDTPEK